MSKVKIIYKTTVEVDLDLKKIEAYLLANSWKDKGKIGPFGHYFAKGDHDAVLPITDQIGDWALRMNELIHDVAEAEGLTEAELLSILQGWQ